jgi:type II secretory pathway pseudopilin PulG
MQAWVGLTTVIAGLLSIPSVLIAQAALNISEQQQRQQEQQQKLAQAESENAAREAYVRRITTWTEYSATDDKPDRIIIQNANALPAQAWIIRYPRMELPRDIRPISLAPCSRVTVADTPPPRWPKGSDFGSHVIARNVPGPELYQVREMGRGADPVVSDYDAWGEWGVMITALDPIDTPEEILKGIERRPTIVDERPAGTCE